jgi:hypothetical protein
MFRGLKYIVMVKSVEELYKNGTIKLLETPSDIIESQVIVTFLEAKLIKERKRIMSFGMFAGSQQSTWEDFQTAEFKNTLPID